MLHNIPAEFVIHGTKIDMVNQSDESIAALVDIGIRHVLTNRIEKMTRAEAAYKRAISNFESAVTSLECGVIPNP